MCVLVHLDDAQHARPHTNPCTYISITHNYMKHHPFVPEAIAIRQRVLLLRNQHLTAARARPDRQRIQFTRKCIHALAPAPTIHRMYTPPPFGDTVLINC